MTSISRGESSSAQHPLLDVFLSHTSTGIPIVPSSLEFVVYELVTVPSVETQVYPVSGRQAVDLVADGIADGRYAAAWTPGGAEPLGAHRIRWFIKTAPASAEVTFAEDFTVIAGPEVTAGAGPVVDGYVTIAELRAEGITTAMASDARLGAVIARVSRQIEFWTGRFFAPRAKTVKLDGTGNRKLLLGDPIISVSRVRILHAIDEVDDEEDFTDIGITSMRVYNRHLTQNLTDPDDRDSPKLEFISAYIEGDWNGHFPRGVQNIEVTGLFGYTDFDGTATGKTPDLIKHAAVLMALREVPLASDTDGRDDIRLRGRLTKMKTRDQEVGYSTRASDTAGAFSAAGAGRMTGDAEIDTILERYARPLALGSA